MSTRSAPHSPMGSEPHLYDMWRRPSLQVAMALCAFALPLLMLPFAVREDVTDEWVRAGLGGCVVRKLQFADGAASYRYALVESKGVYRAIGNAATWQAATSGLPVDSWRRVTVASLAMDPVDPSVLYAGRALGANRSLTAGLYFSQDAGDTWLVSGQEMAGKDVQAVAVAPRTGVLRPGLTLLPTDGRFLDSGVVCVATSAGLYRSDDRGLTWSRLGWRGVDTKILSLALHPEDPETIYLGTEDSGLYWTQDGGDSWKAAGGDLGERDVTAIEVSSAAPDHVYAATDAGVYRSSDAGLTWTETGVEVGSQIVLDVASHPYDERFVCAGVQAGGVYCSSDGSRSWIAMQRGMGNRSVLCLTWDRHEPSVLWAGTVDGVWRYALEQSPAPASPAATGMTPASQLEASPTRAMTPTPTATIIQMQVLEQTASPTLAGARTRSPVPTITRTAAATETEFLVPTVTFTSAPVPSPTRTPAPPHLPPTVQASPVMPTIPLR